LQFVSATLYHNIHWNKLKTTSFLIFKLLYCNHFLYTMLSSLKVTWRSWNMLKVWCYNCDVLVLCSNSVHLLVMFVKGRYLIRFSNCFQ
jgi:hypothetical protein